jgi:hypothetical protein
MVSVVAKKKVAKLPTLAGQTLAKEQQAISSPAAVAPPSPPKSGPVPAPPSTNAANAGVQPDIVPPPSPVGTTTPPPVQQPTPPPIAAPTITPTTPPPPNVSGTTAPMVIPDANLAATVGSNLPPPAAKPADTSSDAFDQAVADLLMSEVQGAGKVDTKAEEDLIRQQMGDAIGQQLVGQRASMGRSGFGSSGALASMEADTQRTARQQALDDVLGLRRTEDQRAKDNANRAIGTDIDKRKQAEEEFFNKAMLDTLNSAIGAEGPPTNDPSNPPDPLGLHVPDMDGNGVINQLDKQAYDASRKKDVVGEDGVIRNKFDPLDPLTWGTWAPWNN